ncbi:MAG: tRNA (N6-isopentenyl adenosine(37)-C2)-methylthiotransferase MiaB [Oscillospiraceae bacterium]
MNPQHQLEETRHRDDLTGMMTTLYGGRKPLCYLHSYGCQQNVADGERIRNLLAAVGYGFCETPQESDLIVLNTCAVRETAEQKVFGTVGEFKKLKAENPALVIAVCGCMTAQEAAAQRLKEHYRHVDLVFGTYGYTRLYELLGAVLGERRRVFDLSDNGAERSGAIAQLRTDQFRAFVPIMTGCNNFCTYCIVPYVRGRETSRAPEEIFDEVQTLVAQGYKEITLLGQNVNSYRFGFPALLRKLDAISGKFRLRFLSSHPKDATRELIDTILASAHICKHLHLPVQAGADRILWLMNRQYTAASYLEIVDYARLKKPDFSFSTDLIVGFPGETYEEFEQTKALAARVKFDNIFSFVYSKRTGTKAADFEDLTDKKTKGLWLRELILAQREVSERWLRRFVGTTAEVLVDGAKDGAPGVYTGKTDEGIIVEFSAAQDYSGEFLHITITKAYNWALAGIPAEQKG